MIDKTKMTALEYREWIGKHLDLNKEILQLTQDEVRSLGMTDEELCEHVRRSMADYAAGKTEMPAESNGVHAILQTEKDSECLRQQAFTFTMNVNPDALSA